MRGSKFFGVILILAARPAIVWGASIDFQLMTWNDQQATVDLPSAVGAKSSAPYPTEGDWLVFTGDDQALAAGYNPLGAISNSLADIGGVDGPAFSMSPSLTGGFTLELSKSAGPTSWDTVVTNLAFTGSATPFAHMNQMLVTPDGFVASDPMYMVDGLTNAGSWLATAADNWHLNLSMDFYLATDVDGDGSPIDVDAVFNDTPHTGYLIPVSELTPAGMSAVALDDPMGYFGGDFEQYLLNEIAPRLPAEATYLMVTQMAKQNPVYTDLGLPITTGSRIGNTIFAFTTQTIIATVAGDYDGDGKVDAADYDLWRQTYFSTTDLRADGNNDRVVDAADYIIWRKNLTSLRTSPFAPARQVPEPGTCLLAGAGIAVLYTSLRRRKST